MKENCQAPSCNKTKLSLGLCNGHYLRYKKGQDITTPIRRQEKGRLCKVDGCKSKHYANNFCVRHWKAWNRQAIKSDLIREMGGKCSVCKDVFHPAAFDFHHLDPKKKDFSITDALNNKSIEEIKLEVSKCILLCANCHRVEHAGEQYA